MSEFSKAERQQLREVAGLVYEAEAAFVLGELEESFEEWRAGTKLSSDLLQEVHEFHQHQSRQLWSMYQGLKDHQIVARGIACGFIKDSQVTPALLKKLRSRIDDFGAD